MEESIHRISKGLLDDGFQVALYTLNQPEIHEQGTSDPRIEVNHLREPAMDLFHPFHNDSRARAGEGHRCRSTALRNAIQRRMRRYPEAQHLVLSFFMSAPGTMAHSAACSLGLPHVNSARGTDFELGIHDVQGRSFVRWLAESADQILTTNQHQARMISGMFRVRRPPKTIHNALAGAGQQPMWKQPPAPPVRLVTDSGLSGRKGTQLLLLAVERLLHKGLPVTLTVLGGIYYIESMTYWETLREAYQERYPDQIYFRGRVPPEEVESYLRSAHIYCSATLAEGCSNSRIRALTCGIPIVTTECGALPELASGCPHVRMCAPGDWEELSEGLEQAVQEILAGTLQPDVKSIEKWRSHFSVERERREWCDAISEAFCEGYPPA